MLKYLLRRVLLFIPTLIIISLLAFIISVNAPGDPVERMMTTAESQNVLGSRSAVQIEQKKLWSHRLGLDLPLFYISITPLSFPDTLYRIYDREERSALRNLIRQYGNWVDIEKFHKQLTQLYLNHDRIQLDSSSLQKFSHNEIRNTINESRYRTLALLNASEGTEITIRITEQKSFCEEYPFLADQVNQLIKAEEDFKIVGETSTKWKNFIPSIHLYSNNQYHRWLFGDGTYSKGLLRGDLGISFVTKMPVSKIIWKRIGWSLLLTALSVLLAYLISVPIGIYAAAKKDSAFDQASSVLLLILYSMPGFLVATLLLMLFANPGMLQWFPSSGVKPIGGYPTDASLLEKTKLSFPFLVLPLIAYTYSSLAFLSRLTRSTMIEVLQQDYIQTARAKGLSNHIVIYKHAFRNALLPLITVFANVFPAAIGGSVIIESIFSIPGMGSEIYRSILAKDYPVIVGVFTVGGIFTLIAYLVADILYAIADPRISFSKK